MSEVKFNYRSIEDLILLLKNKLYSIPEDIDLVVGIPRSGLFFANLIGLYLHKPIADIDNYLEGKILGKGDRKLPIKNSYKKVLIVDDSLWSGKQIKQVKEKLTIKYPKTNYTYIVAYIRPDNLDLVDIYFEALESPRIFEWNILNSWIYSISCTDLDGILCNNPSDEDNDDGEKYLQFVKNVSPKFIPHTTINTIVTSRLEKYRKETESWLKAHSIKYEKLYMLNLPNKETRIKLKIHAKFKAQVYSSSETNLFIESSYWQAMEISKLTQKPVFCSENMRMIVYKENINLIKKIYKFITWEVKKRLWH